MNKYIFNLLIYLSLCLSSYSEGTVSRNVKLFNEDWKFILEDIPNCSSIELDDSKWRVLNLPHDWAIEGDFSIDNPSGITGGALPGGIGWYRKSFTIPKNKSSKRFFIDFDGVYMNSEVYLNGTLLGKRPYGYISFRYDLTPYLKYDSENVLAVRVDNQEQPNSRWYSGCGIYRNVRLTEVNDIYVDLWGTYITTPEVSKEKALISVKTKIKNESSKENKIELVSNIIDENGKNICSVSSDIFLKEGELNEFEQHLSFENPKLWSVDAPYLYSVKTEIKRDGEIIDHYNTSLGIRFFRFDVKKGFFLNDKHLKINGVCMHHDLGCLGAAVNVRAMERQLEILKEMGCNGIRVAHNPPAPELLDLCDKMGFIVMNETFDMWRKKKTKHDYSRYFDEWHQQDLNDIVLRDRNHPSVFMWCIGNEVLEQWDDASADGLTAEEANFALNFGDKNSRSSTIQGQNSSSILCAQLADFVRDLDPTRPVTAGCNEPKPENNLFRSGALDIIGYNYHDDWFAAVPENFPGKPFIVTESVSALMTRGYYRMPSNQEFLWPERWDKPFFEDSFSCSSYDHCRTPWGNRHGGTMKHVKENDFISGQFVWTGFDYIGEPTPFGWPARSSYFGIVDLAGFPKDVYYMYQSEWTEKDVLHLFPHWNWNKGDDIDMWAYYNNADEVELFINNISQGVRRKTNEDFHVVWNVKYFPGDVKAVSRKNGKIVKEHIIHTAQEPYKIRLTADRNQINNDGTDLSFVTVEILDKDDNICPQADNLINFEINGAGFIAGVDNGNPTSLERFKAEHRKAFNGKCLVVIQNNGKNEEINLRASSDKLLTSDITIEIIN